MIAVKRECLQPSELKLVISGAYPPDEFDSAISHLDEFEPCRAACQEALWRRLEMPVPPISSIDAHGLPKPTLGPHCCVKA